MGVWEFHRWPGPAHLVPRRRSDRGCNQFDQASVVFLRACRGPHSAPSINAANRQIAVVRHQVSHGIDPAFQRVLGLGPGGDQQHLVADEASEIELVQHQSQGGAQRNPVETVRNRRIGADPLVAEGPAVKLNRDLVMLAQRIRRRRSTVDRRSRSWSAREAPRKSWLRRHSAGDEILEPGRWTNPGPETNNPPQRRQELETSACSFSVDRMHEMRKTGGPPCRLKARRACQLKNLIPPASVGKHMLDVVTRRGRAPTRGCEKGELETPGRCVASDFFHFAFCISCLPQPGPPKTRLRGCGGSTLPCYR